MGGLDHLKHLFNHSSDSVILFYDTLPIGVLAEFFSSSLCNSSAAGISAIAGAGAINQVLCSSFSRNLFLTHKCEVKAFFKHPPQQLAQNY